MDPNVFPGAATPQQDQPTPAEPIKPSFFGSSASPEPAPAQTGQTSIEPITPVAQPSTPLPDFMLNRQAPEPTQPYVDPKKRLIKFGIIAGIVLLVLAIGYGVFAAIMHSKNSDDKILALMEDNSETISMLDGIMHNATSGNLEVQHLFNEQNHKLLNDLSEKTTNLSVELEKFNPKYANSSISSDFSSVKNALAVLAPAFEQSVNLYNKAYEAYINNNLDPLREILDEENSKPEDKRNESIISAANRFIDYSEEKATLSKNIRSYNCNVSAIPDYIPTYNLKSCDYLVYELDDINKSISESYSVVMSVFSAYIDEYNINEDESLAVWSNNIITALGGSNDETEE